MTGAKILKDSVPLYVYVEREMKEDIEAKAKDLGVSVSELIRRLLESTNIDVTWDITTK
jgi:hypothetical protein